MLVRVLVMCRNAEKKICKKECMQNVCTCDSNENKIYICMVQLLR
jgi:hypothetical protein